MPPRHARWLAPPKMSLSATIRSVRRALTSWQAWIRPPPAGFPVDPPQHRFWRQKTRLEGLLLPTKPPAEGGRIHVLRSKLTSPDALKDRFCGIPCSKSATITPLKTACRSKKRWLRPSISPVRSQERGLTRRLRRLVEASIKALEWVLRPLIRILRRSLRSLWTKKRGWLTSTKSGLRTIADAL